MYVGLSYHIVRAGDGLHWVPKTSPTLSQIYTDVRNFDVEAWRNNKQLMLAITNSEDTKLQEAVAKSALGNSFESAWDHWSGTTP